MKWQPQTPLTFEAGGSRLEGMCFGPPPGEAPTLVLLHGGLDCLEAWGEFPSRLARATGWGVLAWSRAGFGTSDPPKEPRSLARLESEALEILPRVLEAFGFHEGVLVGHGEGAVLAALYAGSVEDHRVRGLVLEAPRFFLEDRGRAAVEEVAKGFEGSDLQEALQGIHRRPAEVFRGWRDTWLDPEGASWNIEEVIDYLRIPVLALQGRDDPYSGAPQLEALETRTYCPVDFAILEGCGHAPHHDRPEETLGALVDFTTRLRRIEEATVEYS